MFGRLLGFLRPRPTPSFELPPPERLTTTESGLRYQLLEPGSGPPPGPTDRVTVRYAGWLESGRPFDASYPGKASFPLDRVIAAWTEGLQLVRPGGAIKLVVPPELGYGARGAPPLIGPNATLVFHVELLGIG